MTIFAKDNALPVVTPLIQQHIANAAFLYQQIKESRFSSGDYPDEQFGDHLSLLANIKGILHANETGSMLTKQTFFRWQTENEAYVYALILFNTHHHDDKAAFIEQIKDNHDLYSGFVYGVACSCAENEVLATWLSAQDPFKRALSIDIHALKCEPLPFTDEQLRDSFNETDPVLLSALCHYCLFLNKTEYISQLKTLSRHNDLSVRYAAVYALAWLAKDDPSIYTMLYALLQIELTQLKDLKGLLKRDAEKRLETLARLCGLFAAKHRIEIKTDLLALPAYLQILMISYAGDLSYIPVLLEWLDFHILARLAFRALCVLTELDIESSELTELSQTDEKEALPVDSVLLELSAGIGLPNKIAIKQALSSLSLNTENTVIKGKTLDEASLTALYNTGYQELRYCAVWHLSMHYRDITPFNITLFKKQ